MRAEDVEEMELRESKDSRPTTPKNTISLTAPIRPLLSRSPQGSKVQVVHGRTKSSEQASLVAQTPISAVSHVSLTMGTGSPFLGQQAISIPSTGSAFTTPLIGLSSGLGGVQDVLMRDASAAQTMTSTMQPPIGTPNRRKSTEPQRIPPPPGPITTTSINAAFEPARQLIGLITSVTSAAHHYLMGSAMATSVSLPAQTTTTASGTQAQISTTTATSTADTASEASGVKKEKDAGRGGHRTPRHTPRGSATSRGSHGSHGTRPHLRHSQSAEEQMMASTGVTDVIDDMGMGVTPSSVQPPLDVTVDPITLAAT